MKPYFQDKNFTLYNGDCKEILSKLDSESINMVITSPPYNKGLYKNYENRPKEHSNWKNATIKYDNFSDKLPREEYIKQQTEIIKELIRAIKEDGSVFYNHKGFASNHKLIYPEYIWNFDVFQEIIWNRKSSPTLDPSRFIPIYEYVFWLNKGEGKRPKFQRNNTFQNNIITILPKTLEEHPAPFPEELVEIFVGCCTEEQDTILDPYIGRGTTAIVCAKNNRKCIGIELSKKYCDLTIQNYKKATSNKTLL